MSQWSKFWCAIETRTTVAGRTFIANWSLKGLLTSATKWFSYYNYTCCCGESALPTNTNSKATSFLSCNVAVSLHHFVVGKLTAWSLELTVSLYRRHRNLRRRQVLPPFPYARQFLQHCGVRLLGWHDSQSCSQIGNGGQDPGESVALRSLLHLCKFSTMYQIYAPIRNTGRPSSLFQTSRWHWFESCVLV